MPTYGISADNRLTDVEESSPNACTAVPHARDSVCSNHPVIGLSFLVFFLVFLGLPLVVFFSFLLFSFLFSFFLVFLSLFFNDNEVQTFFVRAIKRMIMMDQPRTQLFLVTLTFSETMCKVFSSVYFECGQSSTICM